jgi:hypothetical protein
MFAAMAIMTSARTMNNTGAMRSQENNQQQNSPLMP